MSKSDNGNCYPDTTSSVEYRKWLFSSCTQIPRPLAVLNGHSNIPGQATQIIHLYRLLSISVRMDI